jgi:hypothetical protein
MARKSSGALIYTDYRRNHVTWPGREKVLDDFVNSTYKNISHKRANAHSSNSEDALTWSCFDVFDQVKGKRRMQALLELWEDSFANDPKVPPPKDFNNPNGVKMKVGETYGTAPQTTEVDASLEGPNLLVFFEAKLYSTMSPKRQPQPAQKGRKAQPAREDQIAHKIQIGLKLAAQQGKEFYFIFLDIAPREKLYQRRPLTDAEDPKLTGYRNKWKSAYWFWRYKRLASKSGTNPLRQVLPSGSNTQQVAERMGWLTWADLFKIVLRAVV